MTTTDSRIAILSNLNDPPYNEIAEKRCVPWDDAVKLLNAFRAAVLREAADKLDGLTQETAGADMTMPEGRWQAGLDTGIRELRHMADEAEVSDG